MHLLINKYYTITKRFFLRVGTVITKKLSLIKGLVNTVSEDTAAKRVLSNGKQLGTKARVNTLPDKEDESLTGEFR